MEERIAIQITLLYFFNYFCLITFFNQFDYDLSAGQHCELDVNECELRGNSLCNNGICINTEGGYDCFCRPGFSGDHCDINIDECLCGPCKNNATCLDGINMFQCLCQPGYTGKTCEIDVNECDSNPCHNGAQCVNGIASYTCVCPAGFLGMNCEINIDECESSPCMNQGKCNDDVNGYTCDCSDTGFEVGVYPVDTVMCSLSLSAIFFPIIAFNYI